MAQKNSYFKIGLFVISAVVLILIAIFALGAKSLFKQEWVIETYFDKSVQGLEVGSPVKYLGVKVGDVKSIGFVYQEYPTEYNYILVKIRIDPTLMGSTKAEAKVVTAKDLRKGFQVEVDKGLRIKLAMQGITGIAFLEASYLDPAPPELQINWTPKTPYLPSAPNTIERISESLDNILASLSDTDFALLSKKAIHSFSSIDMLLTNQVESMLNSLNTGSKALERDLTGLSSKVNKMLSEQVEPILTNFMMAAEQLPLVIDKIDTSAQQLDRWTSEKRMSFNTVLENTRQVSENLEDITENARKYPSRLFFSDPPPHSEILEKP